MPVIVPKLAYRQLKSRAEDWLEADLAPPIFFLATDRIIPRRGLTHSRQGTCRLRRYASATMK